VLAEERPLQQTHLALAFHAGGWTSRNLAASRILSALLGETMSSLLQQELRERRGICYDLSSQRDLYSDTGLLCIYAAMESSRFPEALRIIVRILARLRRTTLPARAVEQAITCLIGQNALAMEDTAAQMFWVGDMACQGYRQLDPSLFERKLQKVTPALVADSARRLFHGGNAAAAILGPQAASDKQLLLKALRQLA
jgi:predicted Zn-dependent peptidase